MYRIRTVSDPDECRRLWQDNIPQELISDLWEVRDCFHSHYAHRLHFVTVEETGAVRGFLPLSFNKETRSFSYFPGETWNGKTWLEQNRILAGTNGMLDNMLSSLSRPYHLRYLRADSPERVSMEQVDEIGYLFLPPKYGYEMDQYFGEFSHKTAKRLRKELIAWENRNISWRYDEPGDFDIMIAMNLERYGESSYFHDQRFLGSFRSLQKFLQERGWLRMVTVMVDGEPAAVDMGSVYNRTLTLLAGGTSAAFPGVAKLINMQHMSWACRNRLDRVDFLCGDFNWKTLFHLTAAPLYLLQGEGRTAIQRLVRAPQRVLSSLRVPVLRGVGHA